MSVHTLQAALERLGHRCEVEGHERMAILRLTSGPAPLSESALRTHVVSLAAEHGFTHVAVELTDDLLDRGRAGAAVSGD